MLLVFSVLLLSACGSLPKPKETMAVELQASPLVNPDENGRPSPVMVYVLAMRSLGAFERAAMINLIDDPAGTLTGDLVSFRQLTLLPGEQKSITLDLSPEVRYLGVVSSLRNFQMARWRFWIDAPSQSRFGGQKTMGVSVDPGGVNIHVK